MPRVSCPDCGRQVPVHELETRTLAQPSGFATNYRCPFCRADFEDVGKFMV